MNTKPIDNGGSAFPHPFTEGEPFCPVMSLRAYFASNATDEDVKPFLYDHYGRHRDRVLARIAYADTLLAALKIK